MSPTIDPSKLKVTELREELLARGLDTKGNKPVLVKRLKKALEEELNRELPDTSIADTSTEDLDSSRADEEPKDVSESQPVRKESIDSLVSQEQESELEQQNNEDVIQEVKTIPCSNEYKEESVEKEECVIDKESVVKDEPVKEEDENGQENVQQNTTEDEHVKNENETVEDVEMTETSDNASEQKGEKRRRSDGSPDRNQKRRERSPVREDEPDFDPEKVLLSWYDSDLHLLLDKQTFLSGKPLHEGLFGYAWAGVRATHGISSGKVRYEMKITEELKWEDFTNQRRERQEKARERKEKEKQKQEQKYKKDETESDAAKEKEDTNNSDDNKAASEIEEDANEERMDATEETRTEQKDENNEVADKETKEETVEKSEEAKEEDKESDDKSAEKETEKPIEPILTHIFRTGWSLGKTGLQLGEENFSYGYESTGKFVVNKEFKDFAASYKLGDVVGAYLNITDDSIEFRYTVNGDLQSEVISIPRSELPSDEDIVLFPHVLSRNYCFELNLGSKDEPWFPSPEDLVDYPFLQAVENKVQGATRPEKREDCEVILMCGLPGSGKTHWVKEHLQSNNDKKVTVIGCSQLLERMTVRGQSLQSSYNGRWNFLLDKIQRCLNRLCDVACQRRRNYIIDQTNVFPAAQRRKLRAFEGFKRRAVVVVVGDEEQAKRQSLKEAQEGKDVPDYDILNMKASMVLPSKGDLLDEVIFTDLNEEEAKAQVTKYNSEGRAAGYQPGQRMQVFREDKNRWNYKRNDYRGGNFRDHRNFQRYDRGPRGWGQPPPPGRFPRDRRPPPHSMGGGGGNWMRNNRGPPRTGGDRNGRDNRNSSNYNRNQRQSGAGGSRPGSWQSSGGNYHGNWGGQQQQGWGGMGGNQNWNANYQQQSGGNWNANNQWKQGNYNQQQGYGQNWNNYYGQYAQNWTGQATQGAAGSNQYNNQYAQWAQYAQQYAQGQNAKNANVTAQPPKK